MKSKTFEVGTLTCLMTMSVLGHITSEWNPKMPTRLTRKERAQYRAGRNALVAEFAEATGINIMIVEV